MKKSGRRNCAIFMALVALATQAQAGGYQLMEKNARGLGRAYAGEAAAGEDASTVGSNPAAMSRLKRPQFTVSAATIDADLEVEVEESIIAVPALHALGLPNIQVQGVSRAKPAPNYPIIPAVYAVYPLNADYAVGLGVFSNFASKTGYDANFAGRIAAEESNVSATNINPSVSIQLTPMLAFGAGFNAVHTQAELTSANPSASPLAVSGNVFLVPDGRTVGSSSVKGETWGYGWNAGLLLSFAEDSRLGFSYRSPVDADVKGHTRFHNAPNSDPYRDFAATAPMQLPEIMSLSYVQGLGAGLQLSADVTRTGWSNFEDLSIYHRQSGALASRVTERWDDALRYAIGLDYAASSALTLRTGYAYDNTPIPNEHRTLRMPTGDIHFYSLGGSYVVNDTASLDLGYSYMAQARTGIHDIREFEGLPFHARVVGSSKLTGNIFAAQLNIML